MAARKSKRLLWEIMIQLEEAGEEDICSLLNQVMSAHPFFGSGIELAEYLDAVTALERQGELRVRGYRINEGRTSYLGVLSGSASRPPTWFSFDPISRIWKWNAVDRQMVEIVDHQEHGTGSNELDDYR
jgi:hypothetical protein